MTNQRADARAAQRQAAQLGNGSFGPSTLGTTSQLGVLTDGQALGTTSQLGVSPATGAIGASTSATQPIAPIKAPSAPKPPAVPRVQPLSPFHVNPMAPVATYHSGEPAHPYAQQANVLAPRGLFS